MTDHGFRFCPRCGAALVVGLPFCPKCGFNVADIGGSPQLEATPEGAEVDPYDWSQPADPVETADAVRFSVPGPPPIASEPMRRSRGTPIVVGGLVIAAALDLVVALSRARRQAASLRPPRLGRLSPEDQSPPANHRPARSRRSSASPSRAPRTGRPSRPGTSRSSGSAPPGLTITRDVSFGLDQHTTVDGTGHWAIGVRLEEGDNTLVFRIGDDRSTEKRLRVRFVPPSG